MKRTLNRIRNNWWIILVCIVTLYTIFVSIINCPELNRITNTTFNYLNKIIGPIGVVIGLILGYPLLKRKLIENYISRQFELVHDNNRQVRKECLRLKEIYLEKNISTTLNKEFLEKLLKDCRKLNEMAIDANPDAYKYSYLLYKTVLYFSENVSYESGIIKSYYCETLSNFANNHISKIFLYSKSIGFIPKNGSIKEKQIIVSKLKRYVSENKYYQTEDVEFSSNPHSSASLVMFFSINNRCIEAENSLLFKSCYQVVPSPSPMARLLYNQDIYLPLKLIGEKVLGQLTKELVLVGFKREKLIEIGSQSTAKNYLVCHYANITSFGFVKGCLKDKIKFTEFKDEYIKGISFASNDIAEYKVENESVIIKVEIEVAMEYFINVKKKLCRKMRNEFLKSKS